MSRAARSDRPLYARNQHLQPGQNRHGVVTEVLSIDSSTARPVAPRRSSLRSATSDESSFDTAVEETGIVKWFNLERGYGFIARDNGEGDVFVHISAVERSGLMGLNEGDRVAEGRKGPQAAKIRIA
jgi:CspA family cold shock protein